MNFLRNLFNTTQNTEMDMPAPAQYSVELAEVDRDHLQAFQYSIKDIQELKISGVIIRNVLSTDQVEDCLSAITSAPDSEKKEVTSGFIYPEGFSTAVESYGNNEEELKAYFKRNKKFRQDIESKFGYGFESLVENLFSRFKGDLPVEVPGYNSSDGSYISLTAKIMKPGQGSIPVHCGNVLQVYFDEFYSHLKKMVSVFDQISYLIMLQPAKSGGELTLFHTLWRDTQKIIDNSTLENTDEILLNIEDETAVPRTRVILQPGDMIIFSGGSIWHRVEEILGGTDRITIGGFIAFSNDNQKLYYWS